MTDTLDLTRPVQTRDGRPVEIITTKGREPWPIVGYFADLCDPWGWQKDGSGHSSNYDLINVSEPKRSGEVWVNIIVQGNQVGALSYDTKKLADDCAGVARIACIGPIKWTEGEGVEK